MVAHSGHCPVFCSIWAQDARMIPSHLETTCNVCRHFTCPQGWTVACSWDALFCGTYGFSPCVLGIRHIVVHLNTPGLEGNCSWPNNKLWLNRLLCATHRNKWMRGDDWEGDKKTQTGNDRGSMLSSSALLHPAPTLSCSLPALLFTSLLPLPLFSPSNPGEAL